MTDVLINNTGIIYSIASGFTTDISGSWYLTLLLLFLLVVIIALALRIPIEFTAVLVVPMAIVIAAYTSDFVGLLGVILLYLGIVMVKYFPIR